MPEIIDDKSEHCVPFILDRITKHRELYASKGEQPTPFFVGLNGVQGAGKTTLVCKHSITSIDNIRMSCFKAKIPPYAFFVTTLRQRVGYHALPDPVLSAIQFAHLGVLD